jgi:hypothetical protein
VFVSEAHCQSRRPGPDLVCGNGTEALIVSVLALFVSVLAGWAI